MPLKRLAVLLCVPLLLGGCIKFFVVGHTDDYSELMIGSGNGDPLAGGGTIELELTKLGVRCSGSYVDNHSTRRAHGQMLCSDGRRITTESWLTGMSNGQGFGKDTLGHSGGFYFMTDEGSYQRELARIRAEVVARNLSVEHLRPPRAAAAPPQAAAAAPQPAAPPATATVTVLPPAPVAPVAAVAPAAPPPQTAPAAVPAATAATVATTATTTAAADEPAAVPPAPAVKPAAADSGKKLALVVGNATYREAPLKNPVNDARALGAKLQSLGFEVMIGENLGLRDMTRLITRFGERLAGKSVALFFYAGHGMQVKGRNYLIPVDAQIGSEASARSESLDLDQVLDHLGASGASLNLVLLDACRNNPFERRFRSTGGGLAQMEAPKGTLIAFATAPGKVAMDGEGANSTYTTALLRALGEPGLQVESVFKRVRSEVSQATADQQVPWEASSLTGDFYFLPTAARPAPVAREALPADAELLFWQSVKDSTDAGDFDAYLKKYPQGQFADIARNRLKKLRGGR